MDLFTNQGDGSFGPPTRYFAGEDARSLVAADVNHDGALDLVAATGKVMNIFPNDGGTLVLETPDFLIFSSSEAVTIRAGQSADIMLSVFLWPSMPATGPMTFACAGLPALSSCSANPSSIPLTGTILSTVITVDTTQASLGGPARLDIRFPPVYTGLWLFALGCLCVSLGLLRAPGRRLVWGRLTLLCLLLCGTLVVSCGGGSNAGSTGSAGSTGGGGSGVGSSSPGTPLGSYPLSVLATVPTASGPVTHEVAVNLTVAQ